MDAQTKRTLILALIKDDLINTKLVSSLNASGLQADDYLLHLTDTVFTLMGFAGGRKRELVLQRYMELATAVKEVSIAKGHRGMEVLAGEIYGELELLFRNTDLH